MTRALVIKTYGDEQIAGAIVNGIVRDVPQSEAVRRVAMHQHTPEEWAAMVVKAQYDYGQGRTHGRLYGAVWGLIGGLVLAVDGWYKYFSAINREA